MDLQNKQLLLRNDRVDVGKYLCSCTKNYQDPESIHSTISSRMYNHQYGASSKRLPNTVLNVASDQLISVNSSPQSGIGQDEEHHEECNRLTSNDSGVLCRYNHNSCCSAEEDYHLPEQKQGVISRKKTVSFSLDSNTNLTDEQLYVTDNEIDSDLDNCLDLSVDSPDHTSAEENNGVSNSLEDNRSLNISVGNFRGTSNRKDNRAVKMIANVHCRPHGNRDIYFRCNSCLSQMNTMSTRPNRSTSNVTDVNSDHIAPIKSLSRTSSSYVARSQHNFPQCLSCALHDYSRSDTEIIPQSNIDRGKNRSFHRHSALQLLQNESCTELCGLSATSHETRDLVPEKQTTKLQAQDTVWNSTKDKSLNETEVVSDPRSFCSEKHIQICFVILMVLNFISLVAIGYIIANFRKDQSGHQCPLCKDVMEEVKGNKGFNINYTAVQEYVNGKEKEDHCCLDHDLVLQLMTQSLQSPLQPIPEKTNLGDTVINIIRNSTAKAAIHLQSMPINYETSGSSSTDRTISWNFRDSIHVGNVWDSTDGGSKITIPLSGLYYIYVMVQYVYINTNYSKLHDDFPLSVSLCKMSSSDTFSSILGTVTLHCRLASQSIEHNSIIQKLVRLTKGDKVSLVVSNKQFLNEKKNMHQIGLFKVD